jgi:hypothetical protein
VSISGPTNGEVLTWNSTAGKWENEAATGGDTELAELTDVQLATPSDGDVLTYVAAASKWENKPSSGGGSAPAWPRANGRPWRVWYPAYVNFGGTPYGSGGNVNNSNYQPSSEDSIPVAWLYDYTGAGAYFVGYQWAGGPPSKSYFKSRANIGGGGTIFSGQSNDDWRVWLGMAQVHYYGEFNTDTPATPLYAFRYSTALDSTVKCVVSNGSFDTVVDSGIVPDTNFHDFEIDMSDGANIVFLIDDVQVASVPIVFYPAGPVYPGEVYSNPFMSVQALPYGGGSPATYQANVFFQYLYVDYQKL